jgi:hypothetical protein
VARPHLKLSENVSFCVSRMLLFLVIFIQISLCNAARKPPHNRHRITGPSTRASQEARDLALTFKFDTEGLTAEEFNKWVVVCPECGHIGPRSTMLKSGGHLGTATCPIEVGS